MPRSGFIHATNDAVGVRAVGATQLFDRLRHRRNEELLVPRDLVAKRIRFSLSRNQNQPDVLVFKYDSIESPCDLPGVPTIELLEVNPRVTDCIHVERFLEIHAHDVNLRSDQLENSLDGLLVNALGPHLLRSSTTGRKEKRH